MQKNSEAAFHCVIGVMVHVAHVHMSLLRCIAKCTRAVGATVDNLRPLAKKGNIIFVYRTQLDEIRRTTCTIWCEPSLSNFDEKSGPKEMSVVLSGALQALRDWAMAIQREIVAMQCLNTAKHPKKKNISVRILCGTKYHAWDESEKANQLVVIRHHVNFNWLVTFSSTRFWSSTWRIPRAREERKKVKITRGTIFGIGWPGLQSLESIDLGYIFWVLLCCMMSRVLWHWYCMSLFQICES
jgi:hypothetical protein